LKCAGTFIPQISTAVLHWTFAIWLLCMDFGNLWKTTQS